MAEIKISGIEEAIASLRRAPKAIAGFALVKALDRGIGVIAAEVAARCPEDDQRYASATPLKDAIITRIEFDVAEFGAIASCTFSQSQDERTGIPQDLKALLVEYGHTFVTHRGETIGNVVPHPFMRPAAASSYNRAIEVFADTLADEVDKIGEL